jgi:hypothetical protein
MPQSTNTSSQKTATPKVKTFEAFIGPKIKVQTDVKSKTRVINFPFDFPNDDKGVIIICRLTDEDWIPSKDIISININFK